MMKKVMKRAVALGLASLMILSMVGCGNKETNGKGKHNGGKEVEITYWNAGLGTEWLDKLCNAFNESQSDWYVTYTAIADSAAIEAKLGQTDLDETDLYIGSSTKKTEYLEPLDELLDETAKGDKKTIRQKFSQSYLDLAPSADGHIYLISAGGSSPGIVYNTKLFKEAGIEVLPRTTNELIVVCEDLKAVNVTPWAHFQNGGYYDRVQAIWQVQYDGIEYYNEHFLTLTDDAGKSPSLEVLTKQDGRYQTLKVLEKLLTTDNVMPGSNSYDHITAQTMLMKDRIGMMVNGAWLGTEMASVGDVDDFRMMKTPVISNITDKLTTVKDESLLRELVSAIDEVTDGKTVEATYLADGGYRVNDTIISKEDWDYVKKARNTIYTDAAESGYTVPNYSKEKEGAMEFLKYVFSDEGMAVQAEVSHGASFLSFSDGRKTDTEDWNEFEKSAEAMTNAGEVIVTSVTSSKGSKLFSMYLASPYGNVKYIPYFSASNVADRKNADQVWTEIVTTIESEYDSWLKVIQ